MSKPTDFSEQFELLRELLRKVQAKEAVSDDEYLAAGVKVKARIKDIEKQITATKKKVSAVNREEVKRAEREELEELAEANNMTVEEFLAAEGDKRRSQAHAGNFAVRQRAQEQELAAARAKKTLEHEFDVQDLDVVPQDD